MLIWMLDKYHFQFRFLDFGAGRSARLGADLLHGFGTCDLAGASGVVKYL